MSAADSAIWFARNQLYTKQIWWFLSASIGSIALCQGLAWVAGKAFPRVSANARYGESGAQSAIRSRRRNWGRLPLALVNYFRVFACRQTIDIGQAISVTYAEALLTVAYIVAIFTWEFVNTTNLEGSMLDWTYWSGRAGALAVSQLPLITALGTKNSLIAYVTGISFDKLNFIHRMMARVTFILLWIHAGAKIMHLPPASYNLWFARVGLTAITTFTILMLIAFRPIRARFYELFFFTHFLMVLILLVGAYFHATQAANLGKFVWPCFLIWGADRFVRLFRLVYCNTHLFSGSPAGGGSGLDASVELLSPQFVRLRLTRPPQFKWTPGQAAFLVVPGVSRIPFEAHPFTIASVDSRYRLTGGAKRMYQMGSIESEASSMVGPESPVEKRAATYGEEVEFMINVREGFTKRLAEAAGRGGKVRVLVDGPYGFSPDLKDDDTVVLVAGGSGVSLAISTFLGVVSDVQNGRSRCRKVVFVWSIRNPKQLAWISSALINALELAPPTIEIAIRIFVTGRPKLEEPPESFQHTPDTMETVFPGSETPTTTGMSLRMLEDFPAVQIAPGRPDISKLLKNEVAMASGRLSVTVCGSAAIAKTCREALRLPFTATLDGGPSVVLHVESFGYA